MRLFNVTYLQDDDNGSYLTIGTNTDSESSITIRELTSNRWDDQSCLYHFNVAEITEVEGHKITIGD